MKALIAYGLAGEVLDTLRGLSDEHTRLEYVVSSCKKRMEQLDKLEREATATREREALVREWDLKDEIKRLNGELRTAKKHVNIRTCQAAKSKGGRP